MSGDAPNTPTNLRLTQSLYFRLRRAAFEDGLSMSAVVRNALSWFLDWRDSRRVN